MLKIKTMKRSFMTILLKEQKMRYHKSISKIRM